MIDELDQICLRDQTEACVKYKIFDNLRHLESIVANKISEIEVDLEKLARQKQSRDRAKTEDNYVLAMPTTTDSTSGGVGMVAFRPRARRQPTRPEKTRRRLTHPANTCSGTGIPPISAQRQPSRPHAAP
ncbi:MAG: hypothetical protein GPOALKHO_001973 [Sodalis sp.]|nr:MAG: hypothetical protein GPOALKHO_001973 [Sodalis sp.]